MIREEESVSGQAPLSPNNKTEELRDRTANILVNTLPSSFFLFVSSWIMRQKPQDLPVWAMRFLKLAGGRFFGWFETYVTSVTNKQRLQSFSLRSVSEQETGRRGRRSIALGRYQRLADASHATTTSPPTPLSRSQPLLLPSFLSSLSHCKV